jgi:hypothetical protein
MPSHCSGGACALSSPPAANVSAMMGGARTGSARRSAGGGAGCVSRRCAPPCRCLLTAKLLPHRPSRRREALRASVGRWPGWTRSAASPTSARGGGRRWAGILPDRPSRWADHVPRSVGEHVGSRTDAGRRTPSVHCGMPSLLLPARGWLRLGVRRSRILPGASCPPWAEAPHTLTPPQGRQAISRATALRASYAIGTAQGRALPHSGSLVPEHCR